MMIFHLQQQYTELNKSLNIDALITGKIDSLTAEFSENKHD